MIHSTVSYCMRNGCGSHVARCAPQLPQAPVRALPLACVGSAKATIVDLVVSRAKAPPGCFRLTVAGDHVPPGIETEVLDTCRLSYLAEHGVDALRALDGLQRGPDGLNFFSPADWELLYTELCGPVPSGSPPRLTRDMRILVLSNWGKTLGPIEAQPSAVFNTPALAQWLTLSKNGQQTTPGHAMERLMGLVTTIRSNLNAVELQQPGAKSIEPMAMSVVILRRIAELSAVNNHEKEYRTIFSPISDQAVIYLSQIMDCLPLGIQALINTIQPADHLSVLLSDSDSRNPSFQFFWNECVFPHLEDWKKALNKICPPSVILAGGAAAGGGYEAIAAALKENSDATLLGQAALADASSDKATAAGTQVPKSKAVEVAKGKTLGSIEFRAAVDAAKAEPSEALGLQILLSNPDCFRLLNVKSSPAAAATSVHLAYISKMRDFMFMEMEKDFALLHGGRFSHVSRPPPACPCTLPHSAILTVVNCSP